MSSHPGDQPILQQQVEDSFEARQMRRAKNLKRLGRFPTMAQDLEKLPEVTDAEDAVQAALCRLFKRDTQIIMHMRFFEGRNLAEIGNAMGSPRGLETKMQCNLRIRLQMTPALISS